MLWISERLEDVSKFILNYPSSLKSLVPLTTTNTQFYIEFDEIYISSLIEIGRGHKLSHSNQRWLNTFKVGEILIAITKNERTNTYNPELIRQLFIDQ